MKDHNKMARLMKLAYDSQNEDEFLADVLKSMKWYLDDNTKYWTKENFRNFYKQIRVAVGG